MSIASRIQQKVATTIEAAVAVNENLEGVISGISSGYRGLHAHQLNKYGYGSLAKPGFSAGTKYRVVK